MSQIPQRKHSNEELANLRAQKAMQMAGQQVVNPYDKKLAKKPVIILGYLCALVAPFYLIILKFKNEFSYEMLDLKIMCFGTILCILIASFVFFTRSLSRHHASFMIIIALISSFSMIYIVKKDPLLKQNVMIMFGQEVRSEKSQADLILEESLKINNESGEQTYEAAPARRELTPEEIKLREEAKRAFAEAEAEGARKFEAEQKLRENQDTGRDSE